MHRNKLFTTLAVILVLGLALAGVEVWRTYAQGPNGGTTPCGQPYPGYGPGMMGRGWGAQNDCPYAAPNSGYGPGMMGQYGYGQYGPGMMGRGSRGGYGPGMMGGYGQYGPGMMGGYGQYGPGMMGQYGDGQYGQYGMMNAWTWTPPADLAPTSDALTLDGAQAIAKAYIADWNNDNLALGEVMQFDNQFYGEAVESDSGRGAFEFLIDPQTGVVVPEPGPNMMWNLRYGMHAVASTTSADMPVSLEAARDAAQAFLDQYAPGQTVSEEADTFYGYYTFHTLQDGNVVGMLSVNGTTGQVWPHTWHGQFIDMTE